VTRAAGSGLLTEIGSMLAAEAARLASLGWMRGTSGNLSAVLSEDPFHLAVTASGLDKGTLTAADVVIVDALGSPVPGYPAGSRAAPSAEAALHARAARLTGARAVVHVHTTWCAIRLRASLPRVFVIGV
jgi:methylthioribulose-1-phosphate dehydratase